MAHCECGGRVQWAWLSNCTLFSPLWAIMRGGGDDDHGCGSGGKKKEQCLVNMMAKQILFAIIHHK